MRAGEAKRFRALVYAHYRKEGRDFPWRRTTNPYRILVSEIMLQQTQAPRVVPFYQTFVKKFPTVHTLANARLADVLVAWQGLGYNRRAKMLHLCAQEVIQKHGGRIPKTHAELCELPGIGPYTAGAVLAFAYNKAHPVIETNIRTVYLHHFFADKQTVPDRDILDLVVQTLDTTAPREWYAALMDYGVYLKRVVGNQNVRSRHYTRQKAFVGSDRQIRGALVRTLTKGPLTNLKAFAEVHSFDEIRVKQQCEALRAEGLVAKRGRAWTLA